MIVFLAGAKAETKSVSRSFYIEIIIILITGLDMNFISNRPEFIRLDPNCKLNQKII